MNADVLASKLSQSEIPQSSRSPIINSMIKHLVDSGESEGKGSTNNSGITDATKGYSVKKNWSF